MRLVSLLKRISEKWYIVMAIALILAVAFYDTYTVNKKVISALDECNDHWREQLEKVCPHALDGGLSGVYANIDSVDVGETMERGPNEFPATK